MESKYLKRFSNVITEDAKKLYRLNGGRVLIELLPKKEVKTASGLIISAPTDQVRLSADSTQAIMGVVLMTGVGYVAEDGSEIDLDVKPGNIVMVNEFGMKAFSTFPGLSDYTKNTLALTSENEIQMVFPDLDAYNKFESLLNG